jgi:DNA gyrase/topoisomerase IV subunit B
MQHDKILEKKIQIRDDKYISAIKNNDYLLICEGRSAVGGLSNALGRENFGYYELKGLPANLYEVKIVESPELLNLYKIIKQEEYKHVVFATDQDLDGFHIRLMLTIFAYRQFRDEINSGKFMFLQTPLLIIKDNKGNIIKYLFEFENTDNPKYKYIYKKGLGSWKQAELRALYVAGYKLFDPISNITEETLYKWGSKNASNQRKEAILKNTFSINMI